eukprot:9692115-Karenia_brevis.AAC.1
MGQVPHMAPPALMVSAPAALGHTLTHSGMMPQMMPVMFTPIKNSSGSMEFSPMPLPAHGPS